MENKKQVGGSSSSMTFDHLFGPKDPSSASSSSSTGLFGSIFPPPSTVPIYFLQLFAVIYKYYLHNMKKHLSVYLLYIYIQLLRGLPLPLLLLLNHSISKVIKLKY
jgi:hypothetical protein